jgi:glycosyltransferase involved in cell wall biosynthesis
MRILYVVHSVSWKGGGAFFHALHIAKGMIARGHEVTLLCTSPSHKIGFSSKNLGEIIIAEAPDLLPGAARSGWDIWDTLNRIDFVSKGKYDIVHCLDCRPTVIMPGLFLKMRRKSKLVIEWLDWFGKGGTATERSPLIRFFMRPVETFFEEKFRRFADGTIGLGEPLTQRALGMGVRRNVISITHGCDVDTMKRHGKPESRSALGLQDNRVYLGYTGRMREDVCSLFLGTIKELRENKGLDVVGIVIGNTAFPLDKYIDQSLKDYIIKTSWIDYELINKYMCACDLLLLPFGNTVARNKIWPSKLNDYLSVGRPIVATKLEILGDLFERYQIGLLAEHNVTDISEKCLELVLDPERSETYGANARRLAETDFCWTKINATVESLYSKVLSEYA